MGKSSELDVFPFRELSGLKYCTSTEQPVMLSPRVSSFKKLKRAKGADASMRQFLVAICFLLLGCCTAQLPDKPDVSLLDTYTKITATAAKAAQAVQCKPGAAICQALKSLVVVLSPPSPTNPPPPANPDLKCSKFFSLESAHCLHSKGLRGIVMQP